MAAVSWTFHLGDAAMAAHMEPVNTSALLAALVVAAAPLPAAAAPGFAVCVAIDASGQGRLTQTAQPYPRDSARVDADAPAFARAAEAAGMTGAPTPACHWEPTRDKAADYLRRLKDGAGRKGSDPLAVTFSPAG